MIEDDAQTIVQSLLRRSARDDATAEEVGPPHLKWVLITAVERLPRPEADFPASSGDRGVVMYWLTPVGLFKAVVEVLGQDEPHPLGALGTAAWPFPNLVTMIGLEHWVRFATEGLHDVLLTTWTFLYPDSKLHLIKGVPVSTRHHSAAENGAKAFARSIAKTVGWRIIDSAALVANPSAEEYDGGTPGSTQPTQ